MTTSTSRAARAASTASRWPGRNDANPNSSCSAPSASRARATGSGGGGPSPGSVSMSMAVDTGRRPYRRGRRGLRDCDGQRVLERVLALPGGGAGEWVLAGEAGVAVALARAADRLVDAVERQVRERVGAQLGGDLGLGALVRDHLLARRHVDAVVAGMA